jgi:hypothetical protein
MVDWTHIVIHHSATPDGKVNDWEAIRRYHTSYRIDGFIIASRDEFDRRKAAGQGKLFEAPDLDIGYNYGIEEDAGKTILRIGRPLTMPGAHCKQESMNSLAIGICVVGDYDKEILNDTKHNLLVDVCLSLCLMFKIPASNIHPHRQYATYKTCPGKNIDTALIAAEVDALLKIVSLKECRE